jgi:hypothetical protein
LNNASHARSAISTLAETIAFDRRQVFRFICSMHSTPLDRVAPRSKTTLQISLMTWALIVATHAAPWETRAPIPRHVYGHSGAVLGGTLHILGGCHTPDWQVPCRYHQVYDPVADAWTMAAELPLAVAWAMPAVHGEQL